MKAVAFIFVHPSYNANGYVLYIKRKKTIKTKTRGEHRMNIFKLVYEISIAHIHRGKWSKMAKLQNLCQYCVYQPGFSKAKNKVSSPIIH